MLEALGRAFLFLLLFVPTTYQPIKAGMMLVLLAGLMTAALREDRLAIHPVVAKWTLFCVTVGLFFMTRGLTLDAPGALRVGTVYVLWPVVYLVFVHGLSDERVLWAMARTMVVAAIAVTLYTVSYVLYAVGWLPPALYLPIEQGQAIGLHDGYVEINLYSLSSLLFLVPFSLAGLLVWPRDGRLPISRGWTWVALIGGLLIIVLSGRRALLLIVALAPLFVLMVRGLLPRATRAEARGNMARVILTGGVCLLAVGTYLYGLGITPSGVFDMFLQGFDFSREASAIPRRDQWFALWRGWAESPWLGAGHGASAPGVIRAVNMPWAYELSYVALLYQTGLVGFAAYSAAVGWLLIKLVRVVRVGDGLSLLTVPVLVGMLCFLVGNATNPYLAKFDFLWVVFLPLAIVNHWLVRPTRGDGGSVAL